jgi:hypothetical protein
MKKQIKSFLFKTQILKNFKGKGVFINRINPLTYISMGFIFCFYFVKQDMPGLVDFITTEQ